MVRASVSINKILCKTIIGIYPDELSVPQNAEFGFSFEYDCERAIDADSIEHAIDYAELAEELKAFVSSSKFSLLETLAAEIAKKILAFSPKITTVKSYCIKLNSLQPKAEIILERNKH
jgi:dihydroneopterin aldolase